jgi:phosphoglycerate kinase
MQLDKLKTAAGIDLRGKRVLVRADLNVPAKDGRVTDATRLQRIVPGLEDLSERGARIVVISHFGRPKGGPDPQFVEAGSGQARGVARRPVAFATDCIGEATPVAGSLGRRHRRAGELRFHAGEERTIHLCQGAGQARRYLRRRRLLDVAPGARFH